MEKLIISRKDIVSNLETVRKYAKVQLIGVIDQNGYGCGSRYLARTFVSAGIQMLAASDAETVHAILDEFPQVSVLLLCPVFGKEELACVIHRGAVATVDDIADVVRLNAAAEDNGVVARVHLLIRSHKNGCGLSLSQAERMADVLHSCRNIEVDGAYTHIDPADAIHEKVVLRQKAVFDATVERLTGAGIRIPILHMADGYSAMRYPGISYNAVRVGDAAIGRMEGKDRWGLTPVGQLQTTVIGNTTVCAEEEKDLRGKERTYAVTSIASLDAVLAATPMGLFFRTGKRMICTCRGKRYHVVGRCGNELFLVNPGREGLKAEDVLLFPVDPRLVNGHVVREYIEYM